MMDLLASHDRFAGALGMERLQNRGWGESICFLVHVDEVCLEWSAQGIKGWVCTMSARLTSMPSVGMSVTISNSRQKAKKMYPSIPNVLPQRQWRLVRRCRLKVLRNAKRLMK